MELKNSNWKKFMHNLNKEDINEKISESIDEICKDSKMKRPKDFCFGISEFGFGQSDDCKVFAISAKSEKRTMTVEAYLYETELQYSIDEFKERVIIPMMFGLISRLSE